MAILQEVLQQTITISDFESFEADKASFFSHLDIAPTLSKTGYTIQCHEALDLLNNISEADLQGLSSEALTRLMALRRTLLEAVIDKLTQHGKVNQELENDRSSYYSQLLRDCLMLALFVLGLIFSACQGMTGLMSLISYFSLSQTAALIAISIFSSLAVFVFLIYDFQDFSVRLGNPLRTIKSWLKDILDQQRLLIEGYQTLSELAKQQSNLSDADFQQDINNFRDVFKRLSQSIHDPITQKLILSSAEIKSWLVWIFQNVLAHFAALVWALNGYFVGKSAASIILGFCSYDVMLLISEWLTFGLSSVGFIMAAALFYKGEYYGIINHVNYWAGIPENFISKFLAGLADMQRAEEALDDKLAHVFSEGHDEAQAFVMKELSLAMQQTEALTTDNQTLNEKIQALRDEFGMLKDQSSCHVLKDCLNRQRNLTRFTRLYQQHRVLLTRYDAVLKKTDDQPQYTSRREELIAQLERYRSAIKPGFALLSDAEQLQQACDTQQDALLMVATLRDCLDGIASKTNFFKQQHDPITPVMESDLAFQFV